MVSPRRDIVPQAAGRTDAADLVVEQDDVYTLFTETLYISPGTWAIMTPVLKPLSARRNKRAVFFCPERGDRPERKTRPVGTRRIAQGEDRVPAPAYYSCLYFFHIK